MGSTYLSLLVVIKKNCRGFENVPRYFILKLKACPDLGLGHSLVQLLPIDDARYRLHRVSVSFRPAYKPCYYL